MKDKDKLFLEVVKPLIEEIDKLVNSEEIDKENEKKIYKDLVNAIEQLKNDKDLLRMLAIHVEREFVDFYRTVSSSKAPSISDWEEWKTDLEPLIHDLEGDFSFSQGAIEYNLNGSSLEIVRILSRYYNLKMNLHNIHKIKLSKQGKNITVEIVDSLGNVMADWIEYAKTESVAIVRLGPRQYRYEFRGSKKR